SLEQRTIHSQECVRVPLSARRADRIRPKPLLTSTFAAGSIHGIVVHNSALLQALDSYRSSNVTWPTSASRSSDRGSVMNGVRFPSARKDRPSYGARGRRSPLRRYASTAFQ